MICFSRAAMRPFSTSVKVAAILSLSPALFGQFRGGSDWSASGSDAQRTSWIRSDAKISPTSVNSSALELLWKVKLGDKALSAPVLLDRYIGYRGFRTYVFVGGGHSEDAFGLDSDLGRVEWRRQLSAKAGAGSGNCSSEMTSELSRPLNSSLPSNAAGSGRFGGRGGPAKSGVGEPLEGSVTLAQVAATRPPTSPSAAQPAARPTPPRGGFGPRATLIYGISDDGALHTMYVSNGEDAQPAIPFLPANADVHSFSVVDGVGYASLASHCGGTPDQMVAVNLETKEVIKWDGSIAGGEPAFAPTGIYLTAQNKLLALDPKTLSVAGSYDAAQPFTTSPSVFEYRTKVMVAAATKDGVLHLVDAASPSATAAKSAAGDPDPYALATWQTTAETRWIIVTSAKSITAWKIIDRDGSPTLQQGWAIHDVNTPAAPLIINGVLFALDRGDSSHPAVLAAYDASSGKQLWASGTAVSSFVGKSGGLAAGGSSLYFGTHDGTLWAFGFPIEH